MVVVDERRESPRDAGVPIDDDFAAFHKSHPTGSAEPETEQLDLAKEAIMQLCGGQLTAGRTGPTT